MPSAAICFSQLQAPFAAELADYLALQTPLQFDLAECSEAAFLDTIEQCFSKDFVVVVLCAHAMRTAWSRQMWEPVLIDSANESGTRLCFLMLEDCPFPGALRRRNFFDFRNDQRTARRKLRQWLLQALDSERSAPDISGDGAEDWSLQWLLDEPGLAENVSYEAALWSARNWWRDFAAVYWLEGSYLSHAGLLGELSAQVGLRLTGTAEQNLAELQVHAAENRALYIFEGSSLDLGGKASALVVPAQLKRPTFEEIKQAFTKRRANKAPCLRAWNSLTTGHDHLDNWPEVYSLSLVALQLLLEQGRLAEAQESLGWLAKLAKQNGDAKALDKYRWEEYWIFNEWSVPPHQRDEITRTLPSQILLPLVANSGT